MDNDAVRSNFIKAIYAERSDYPLYDNHKNPVEYYFSPDETLIWQAAAAANQADLVTPIAISPGTKLRITLADGAAARLKKVCMEPIQLEGSYNDIIIFQCSDVVGHGIVEIKTPTKNGIPKPLPLALTGNITWKASGMGDKTAKFEHDTDATVYIFPKNLPSYFDNVGISLPLLVNNSFLPRWMDLSDKDAKGLTWPEFVVDTMFNHCKFQYESYSGASKYLTWTSTKYKTYEDILKNGEGCNFWIDLFTADMVWRSDTHQLNCYDLAAICQAFIALGIDQSTANLQMVYLKPFGYINRTRLIGRFESDKIKLSKNPYSECNNPFYMDGDCDSDMLCKEDSSTRSKFGNHMFLSMNKGGTAYILDACAGPHKGTEDLNTYIKNSIDSTPARYAKTKSSPGKSADAQAGMGIRFLVTSRAFEKTSNTNPNSKSMLDSISQSMNDEVGEWTQPFLSFPNTQDRSTATWTFSRPNRRDVYWINVFKYTKLDELKDEFARRTLNTPGYTNRPGRMNEGYADKASGSVIIWYDPDPKRLYMATIEAAAARALVERPSNPPLIPAPIPALCVFKDKFQNALNIQLASPKPADDVIQKWEGTDKSGAGTITTRRNKIIYVDIYSDAFAKDYWRGFQVKTAFGNILFLGAKPYASTAVTRFKFLARREGIDGVRINLYGSHLDTESVRIDFNINPPTPPTL